MHRWRRIESAAEPGGVGADRGPRAGHGWSGAGTSRARAPMMRAPAAAEDVLARLRLVRCAASGGKAAARARGRRPAVAVLARAPRRRPGGTRSALSSSTSSSRAPGVSAVTSGVAAREGLERLVRDHALRLAGGAEDPERATGPVELPRQALVLDPRDPSRRSGGRVASERVELAAADEPEAQLGRRAGRRRGSSRRRAAGSACRRRARVNGSSGCTSRVRRRGPRRRRTQTSIRSRGGPASSAR